MPSTGDRRPRYLAIADELEHELSDGRHAPGDRLAPDDELARRFAVNRHTIARALGVLQDKGLVNRVRGHGSFVSPGRLTYRVGRDMSFSNSVARLGIRNAQRVVSLACEPADAAAAAALAIAPAAPVVRLRRVRYAASVPLAVLDKRYPQERFPGLERVLAGAATISTRRALRDEYGAELERASSLIDLHPADQELGRLLGVAAGAALLRLESVDVLEDRTPAEWGVTWFRADLTRIQVDLLDAGPS